MTRRKKRLTHQKFGLVCVKDMKRNHMTPELPADISREELQKLQDTDETLTDVQESAKHSSHNFF
jgi:hypothetical protein